MKLSAPLYQLKRRAKALTRTSGIALHEALDEIAASEGYARWSLLAACYASQSSAATFFNRLNPGDLALIGARPGQGKTLLGLRVAAEASRAGHRAMFFSLEYTESECHRRLRDLQLDECLIDLDCSDNICADYIVERLSCTAAGTLAVVDYLQLLDQRRSFPPLSDQIETLKRFARQAKVCLVFLSQIDRSYDPAEKACPDLTNVRLPNALDLGLFDHACFLNGEDVGMVTLR